MKKGTCGLKAAGLTAILVGSVLLVGCGNSASTAAAASSSAEPDKPSAQPESTAPAEQKEAADFSAVPEGFRIVTIGSGAPGVNPERGNASTLVQYKDKYFLVDCGYGTCLELTKLGLPNENITNLLITHEHEDHNADFTHFLVEGWYTTPNGRTHLNLVGPQVSTLYENTYDINKDDIEGRLEVASKQGNGVTEKGISEDVVIRDLTENDESSTLDGVAIEAQKVLHGNMNAYSYKFTADGHSVVVTGDVAYTDDLKDFYKDADILVIDAVTMTGYFANIPEEQIEKSLGNTHMTESQMAKLLADTQVKNVVLTHISGSMADYDGVVQTFKDAGYRGIVYEAYDGLSLEL